MRQAALVLALCSCPSVPTTPPPSEFNGVWASRAEDGGLRGILVHDLQDGGVVWSPKHLEFLDGGLVIGHRCRDFAVDATSGQVIAAAGVVPAGVVTEASGGFGLTWTASTGAIVSAHDLRPSSTIVERARLSGEVADGSFGLRIDWLASDGSIEDSEVTQFQVTRQFTCD